MKFVKILAVGAILAAGAAFAEGDRTDPNALARSELMKIQGMNTGILGNMASGKEPFDAAKAEAAKAALIEASSKIEATFMEPGRCRPGVGSQAGNLDQLGGFPGQGQCADHRRDRCRRVLGRKHRRGHGGDRRGLQGLPHHLPRDEVIHLPTAGQGPRSQDRGPCISCSRPVRSRRSRRGPAGCSAGLRDNPSSPPCRAGSPARPG
jgi:hypothetical protein